MIAACMLRPVLYGQTVYSYVLLLSDLPPAWLDFMTLTLVTFFSYANFTYGQRFLNFNFNFYFNFSFLLAPDMALTVMPEKLRNFLLVESYNFDFVFLTQLQSA